LFLQYIFLTTIFNSFYFFHSYSKNYTTASCGNVQGKVARSGGGRPDQEDAHPGDGVDHLCGSFTAAVGSEPLFDGPTPDRRRAATVLVTIVV
jgi:hypothetical protein